MTETPKDELFPQDGSVRPVTVEPKAKKPAPSIPELAPVETATPSESDNLSEGQTVITAEASEPSKLRKPPAVICFADRIAKVQGQTVDIKQQLDNINFTDQ